jgi:hypothetical protein
VRTDLVGRGRELGDLRRRLSAALDGRPSAVVVAGEAGIGKTALHTVNEWASRADADRFAAESSVMSAFGFAGFVSTVVWMGAVSVVLLRSERTVRTVAPVAAAA